MEDHLSGEVGEEFGASPFGLSAGLSTDPAVIMGVFLAFLGTERADKAACFQQCACVVGVNSGASDQGVRGRRAHVCAVLVRPNTPLQWLDGVLGQAGIGAGSAGLRTLHKGFHCGEQSNRVHTV